MSTPYQPIHVTDAGGQTFSIEGCKTIRDLKESILEHTGIPINQQKLERCEESNVELVDASSLEGKEHLRLLVKMDGGCECRPFYIRIKDFQCKFRCSICYSGMDLEWSKCQYCCVHWGCTVQ